MVSASMAQYYELSWAILSTIGLNNVFVGAMVMGIAGFSMVSLVPLLVSVATAVANGMCYYSFYANHPVTNTAVASAFADMCWLVQEAGLSFYSYAILVRVLVDRERLVFLALFWALMAAICALRLSILVQRQRYILDGSNEAGLQRLVDHLHVGYFACIAAVECVSAVFLLKTFNAARRISIKAALRGGLFSYLMRSTEIRLALLAIVGVTRAVTYSFQTTAQSAEGVAGQLDRFAYTLECLFPVVMFIDILASRLVFAINGHSRETSSSNRIGTTTSPVHMQPVHHSGWRTSTLNDRKPRNVASSQEHIMDDAATASEIEFATGAQDVEQQRGGPAVNKTIWVGSPGSVGLAS